MSESIKNKAIRGVAWSAVEKFARQGLMVFFSILIARQLSPADYGLVAMLTIFLVVAQIFVDSGFVEALIQKRDRTEVDFSTTFWFNIGVAAAIYGVLFLLSPLIAGFYGGAVTGGADGMDGLDLRDQLVPDGATGETEHRNGFPSAGVDLVSSHLGERRDGCLDGLSGIRGVDVGLAGLAAKPAQRGVTLGIGGLDALARVLPPLVPVFL